MANIDLTPEEAQQLVIELRSKRIDLLSGYSLELLFKVMSATGATITKEDIKQLIEEDADLKKAVASMMLDLDFRMAEVAVDTFRELQFLRLSDNGIPN